MYRAFCHAFESCAPLHLSTYPPSRATLRIKLPTSGALLCVPACHLCRGSDLVFDTVLAADGSPVRYAHKPGGGVMHSGTLPHHVEPLGAGTRENIIIWVTCGTSSG